MAESNEPAPVVNIEDDADTTPGYKPPAEKSMDEMLKLDQDDESLQKYKQSLLGDAAASAFCKQAGEFVFSRFATAGGGSDLCYKMGLTSCYNPSMLTDLNCVEIGHYIVAMYYRAR